MVELRVVAGRSAGTRVSINQFPFSIGRSSKAGLCLSDVGIWDLHAQLTQLDDGTFVLRPASGAIVTVEEGGVVEHRLRNGDLFNCGGAKVRFWISPAPARSLLPREVLVWALLLGVVVVELLLLLALG